MWVSVECAPPSQADRQTIDVNVAPGSLVISTPYTPDHPFDLGELTVDSSGSALVGSARFPAAGDHLLISDTRVGDLPWIASASATDFVGAGGSIDVANLSLTHLEVQVVPGDTLGTSARPVQLSDITSFTLAPQPVATAEHGRGSVWLAGLLTLTCPTSTPAGDYSTTITFTLV